ncbi:lipoate--protein ligase family protein [Corynebacterium phoceense]|uniref:lipoate--protein ligase family protein n=1 Tax=Corynebacterium phoceense TaxID=1686286 RepID=UPI00211C18FA|nr:biotin/lipoate A/B protein ligase family protein [Corynebacterium phoceense]MCQ9330213.1 lipoate--protein ligase family protein [Corynebacterium phoceense]MCQ9345587.1 lipoate--protein ligase family protein [Corynebacterium phoceense]MCQ9347370.1 lipoate--protein ligase family protein [Corynebacterium phoceense]
MTEANKHFELKVPGGKLIVVDITVDEAGAITAAQVAGDFFLEPEDAYEALAPALVGTHRGEATADIQGRLDAALARIEEPVALHGFSTHDLAVTVQRALSDGTDFTDHEWEILQPGVLPTPVNVALDELLLDQVATGQRGPTLRFWEWDDRAVVFGSYQSYSNELDQAGVDKHGITPVRRMSGGGAMFMEGGNCITYSIYAPESLVAGYSYEDSYAYLDQWVLAALAKHGVNAWYVPINDITSDGGKIGGAAQKRRRGAVLHHTTMSYDIDADKMMDVLRIGKVKVASKGLASAKKRVDPLRRQTGVPREEIIATMAQEFATRYGARPTELTEADLAAARDLVDTKYATEAWTKRLP